MGEQLVHNLVPVAGADVRPKDEAAAPPDSGRMPAMVAAAEGKSSIERGALLAIFLVGTALRGTDLDILPGFNGDEGWETYYASLLAQGHWSGVHPVRPYLGPGFQLLNAPFLAAFGVGVWSARLGVALLGLLCIPLAYAIGRRLGGAWVGLGAAALVAVAPFAVVFSRIACSVSTVPFWTLLCWWLLQRLIEIPDADRALVLGLALGAAVSFHPQALLLGPAVGVGALAHPGGRALLLRPRVLFVGGLGFGVFGWTAAAVVLDQLGLGGGLDYSGTHIDAAPVRAFFPRLLHSLPVILDGAAGGRILHWAAGPSQQHPLGAGLAAALLGVSAVGACVRLLRSAGAPGARSLAAALLCLWLLTVHKAAAFDLGMVSRERYLLALWSLSLPLIAWALLSPPQGGRSLGRASWSLRQTGLPVLGLVAVLGLVEAHATVLGAGFFGPLQATGGDAHPSMRVATPDAKAEGGRWIQERLEPGEEGLLLAGDAWSYWPLVTFVEGAVAVDYIAEDPAECAAVLERTRHRRRFLIDYAGWHWNQAIASCLKAYGRGDLLPVWTRSTQDGRPLLWLWELPPEAVR